MGEPAGFVLAGFAFPGEEDGAEPGEEEVGDEADDADHGDGGIDVVEVPVAGLLVDEKSDA